MVFGSQSISSNKAPALNGEGDAVGLGRRRAMGYRSLLKVIRAVPPATCETAALPHPLRRLQ
jgi:hypothetical protein